MTNEKILEVIERYEQRLPDEILLRSLHSNNVSRMHTEALQHLLEMFPQMREFVRDGRREKLMRWLGWVQGVLFMCGIYTLEEMKAHNMPSES